MRIGSLFSGAGGLDLAVEQVFGGRTVWHCELDPAASKVLAHRWPGVPNLGDITAVDWSTVEATDILCGGFPCQDVSAAGRRAGIAVGTRSGLWLEFANAIDRLRPRIVVIENVRGLLSGYAHRTVESVNFAVGDGTGRPVLRAAGAVLGDLADLGYDAQWVTVSAASVGAPHRRERVFILAVDANATGECGTDITGCGYAAGQHVVTVASSGDRDCQRSVAARVSELGGTAAELAAVTELLPTPGAADCTGGGASPEVRQAQGHHLQLIDLGTDPTVWGKYEPAIRRWESLTRPYPAPTEPGTRGNLRLAAVFPEWMMGWPAGWVTQVTDISRNDALRIIGNGVCPQQAIAALRWLLPVSAVAA